MTVGPEWFTLEPTVVHSLDTIRQYMSERAGGISFSREDAIRALCREWEEARGMGEGQGDRCDCGALLPAWRNGQWTIAGWVEWAFQRRDCDHCGEVWFRSRKREGV